MCYSRGGRHGSAAAVPIPTEEPVIGNEIVPETVNVPPIVEPTAPPVAEIETTVSVEQQLFGDEQTVRPRMDKQVILSLYGDAPTQPTHPHNPTPQARSYEAPHPAPPVAAPEPAGQNGPASDTAAHKKVLGETFANGNGVAMNEVLGKQTAHADVASKLQSQSISGDLRQCIGINDRFMLIRSLFNGNADQYAAAIAQLNAFTDLNDALLYIQENYQWDPDSEGVRLLVDLLERKLG